MNRDDRERHIAHLVSVIVDPGHTKFGEVVRCVDFRMGFAVLETRDRERLILREMGREHLLIPQVAHLPKTWDVEKFKSLLLSERKRLLSISETISNALLDIKKRSSALDEFYEAIHSCENLCRK